MVPVGSSALLRQDSWLAGVWFPSLEIPMKSERCRLEQH